MNTITWQHNEKTYSIRLGTAATGPGGTMACDVVGFDGRKAYTQLTRDAAEQIVNHLADAFDLDEISDDDGLYITDEGQKILDDYVAAHQRPLIVINHYYGDA